MLEMKLNWAAVGLGVVLAGTLHGAVPGPLRSALQAALTSPPGHAASWGALAMTADGTVVYATNASRTFIPASNTKLFSGALALDRLGAAQVLRTPLLASASPDADGVLKSDLWIVGQGDPALGANPTNSLFIDALQPLADLLYRQGVRQIEGDLVVCDAAVRTPAAGPGWDPEDLIEWYGAPVSAFVVNDNTFRVVATPAETAGLPGLFRVEPDLPSIRVDWKVVTSTNKTHAVSYVREPATGLVRFSGRIPLGSRPWTPELSVAQAPQHFGESLRDSLGRRGIDVSGGIRVVHATNGIPSQELATWTSEPLALRLRRCLKPSQNLHAQLLLVQVGMEAARTLPDPGVSDDQLGLRQLPAFLRRAGVPEGSVRLEEGSGLSRTNAVTPAATVALLRYMRHHADSAAWMSALPVGGVDGTLKNRFRKGPATGNVRAKTGSLRGVNALGGYLTTAAGEEITFAIYANEATADPEARTRMDRWVELLASQSVRLGN
jgi:D-alanyl-D-alanine carboxypeptidase/D-alanyl-D-alanine-endopeptidase (penicillin-binding protein 4)